MKKIEYAWIQQILSFDSPEEREAWLLRRNDKLSRKNLEVNVMKEWTENGRAWMIIRLPYNNNCMVY